MLTWCTRAALLPLRSGSPIRGKGRNGSDVRVVRATDGRSKACGRGSVPGLVDGITACIAYPLTSGQRVEGETGIVPLAHGLMLISLGTGSGYRKMRFDYPSAIAHEVDRYMRTAAG